MTTTIQCCGGIIKERTKENMTKKNELICGLIITGILPMAMVYVLMYIVVMVMGL